MHLFDGGYEKLRETHLRQPEEAGRVPKDAKLTPWPSEMLKPWDQLTADEKKLFIRQVEVFAAYAAYSDHEIGRVIQAFQDLGKLDNTLIIYINGDNGTSAEGGPMGTPNEVAFFNGVRDAGRRADEVVRRLGHRADLQPHVGRLVVGLRHAVRLVQAERLAARRHQPEHGGVVAGAHQGQGRPARAVRARHRRRADHPRSGRASRRRRWSTASSRRRSRAPASPTPSTRPMPRRVAAQDAVLRDDGPVGAL
jgi:arylsulfatase A-like enzyme